MRKYQNIYKIITIALIALFVMTSVFMSTPSYAAAFWPFSNVLAHTRTKTTFISGSNVSLLHAATNLNPSPIKKISVIAMTGGSSLIAESGPDGTAADINPAAANGQISLYVVRSGDSLSEIAKMFGVSEKTILWANNIRNARLIRAGDTLLILPVSGIKHTVKKGETLTSITKKYRANSKDTALYNSLDQKKPLVVGSVVIIPGGEMPTVRRYKKSYTYSRRSRHYHRIRVAPSNPYRGGSGPALPGFFSNPLSRGIVTQALHGWNAFDIGARTGTPIRAAAAGRIIVSRVGGWNGGYGNYVVINHGNGTQTLYSHMVRDVSSVGQRVRAGQVIGYVGETGEATGPHLHFEVRGARNPFVGCRVGSRCNF